MKHLFLALATVWICACTSSSAQTTLDIKNLMEGQTPPSADIEDIAWLAGTWEGTGLGGKSKEVIAPARGGQMMGMFSQTDPDGAIMFYEFYIFAEQDGSLVQKIKHFNPDLTSWEEKDDYELFPLVAIEGETAYFDGITWSKTGPDELTSTVNVEGQRPLIFVFQKVD